MNKLHLIVCHDVFVLVDDGRARPVDYARLRHVVVPDVIKHPNGVGALIIVPPSATPPPDDSRIAMNELLRRVETSLRCLCWLVEGSGFQGAMARAVLTGLKAFGRFPYPCHVSSNVTEALGWIFQKIDRNKPVVRDVDEGVRLIAEERRRFLEGDSAPSSEPLR